MCYTTGVRVTSFAPTAQPSILLYKYSSEHAENFGNKVRLVKKRDNGCRAAATTLSTPMRNYSLGNSTSIFPANEFYKQFLENILYVARNSYDNSYKQQKPSSQNQQVVDIYISSPPQCNYLSYNFFFFSYPIFNTLFVRPFLKFVHNPRPPQSAKNRPMSNHFLENQNNRHTVSKPIHSPLASLRIRNYLKTNIKQFQKTLVCVYLLLSVYKYTCKYLVRMEKINFSDLLY